MKAAFYIIAKFRSESKRSLRSSPLIATLIWSLPKAGRLFWMIDGYTISDRFPYSEPMRRRGMNYIRNSVKTVVDAYNGTVIST